jgi:hypothetical protein
MVMITDIKQIEKLAEERSDENWRFRTYLKGYDSDKLDTAIHRLYSATDRLSVMWQLLQGYASTCIWLSEDDKRSAILEARAWLDKHPIAKNAAFTAWYKKRFVELGGPVSYEEYPEYMFYKQ